MKKTKLSAVLFAAVILTAANAHARTKDDIAALQIGQQETERRLDRLESQLQNQGLLEMLQLLQRMQAELQELRGELEQQSNELQSMRKRQRELYLDIDRRLTDIQLQAESVAPVPVESAAPAGEAASTATSEAAASVASADPNQERGEYKVAFEILREGRYPEAIEVFTEFLKKYPDGNYADNAQYWLGEANYVSRNFQMALAEFNKVIERYPRSPKVADAKLKIGYTHYELQQWEKARTALNSVLTQHSNTSAAPLAEKRLLQMVSEGR